MLWREAWNVSSAIIHKNNSLNRSALSTYYIFMCAIAYEFLHHHHNSRQCYNHHRCHYHITNIIILTNSKTCMIVTTVINISMITLTTSIMLTIIIIITTIIISHLSSGEFILRVFSTKSVALETIHPMQQMAIHGTWKRTGWLIVMMMIMMMIWILLIGVLMVMVMVILWKKWIYDTRNWTYWTMLMMLL